MVQEQGRCAPQSECLVNGTHELTPRKSTHVPESTSKESSRNRITLSWVAALWDPLHRINDQVRRSRDNAHVPIKGFSESFLRYALI